MYVGLLNPSAVNPIDLIKDYNDGQVFQTADDYMNMYKWIGSWMLIFCVTHLIMNYLINNVIRLPYFNSLTDDEKDKMINMLNA